MDLNDFGFEKISAGSDVDENSAEFALARVVSEQKERYCIVTAQGEYDAEITGNMRYAAQGRDDFPAVGDWVRASLFENNFALIHSILPRYSVLKRSAIEKFGESQIIAANIDYSLILSAADRDFNINRVERYLTICNEANIKSIIVLTKIDLLDQSVIEGLRLAMSERIPNVPTVFISNETLSGYEQLNALLLKGSTYCMIGSSGVGKSTLLNRLSGKEVMKTADISAVTNKGRHTTSYRELVALQNGAIMIDNPGMREVGIGDSGKGLEITYDRIKELAQGCRFRDCTHENEAGCAVLAALANKEIDPSVYENFMKLENENRYFHSTVVEKRKKDRDFGKMVKNYMKDKKQGKF
jgi:ribosome biogenesis GTPase